MAQFTILAQTKRGDTILTDYSVADQKLAGLTFDESLNETVDGYTFTFSALKYYYDNTTKVVNQSIMNLTYGTIIQILTNNKRIEFVIQDIQYNFLADNLQFTYTCIDRFQDEASHIAVGYTISDDTTDPSYVGAQSIDNWARRIISETNLNWGYVPIDEINDVLIKLVASPAQIKDRNDFLHPSNWNEWDAILRGEFANNIATLNDTVSFTCTNTNAYAALKQLASDNELILMADYSGHNLYFIPQKNWWFKGVYLNPNFNLQQFGLKGVGSNIITVLNVKGPTDVNDMDITLVPDFPDTIQKYIDSTDWTKSLYSSDLYTQIDPNADARFLQMVNVVPWLENKLIDFDFFVKTNVILQSEADEINNILTNDLRIVNGRLIKATRDYYTDQEKWLMKCDEYMNEIRVADGAISSEIDTYIENATNNPYTFQLYVGQDTTYGNCLYAMTGNVTSNDWKVYCGNIRFWHEPDSSTYFLPFSEGIDETQNYDVHWHQNIPTAESITINIAKQINVFDRRRADWISPGKVAITDLDERINDITSVLGNAYQALLENYYKWKQAWETDSEFYLQCYKIGVTDLCGVDTIIELGQPISSVPNSGTISQDQIDIIQDRFIWDEDMVEQPANPTRGWVIGACARIAANFTKYWSAAYSNAILTGYYLPNTWDCLAILENTNYSQQGPYFKSLLALKKENDVISRNTTLGVNYIYRQPKSDIYRFSYYDTRRDIVTPRLYNWNTNHDFFAVTNTDNYYQTGIGMTVPFPWNQLERTNETVQLFGTRLKFQDISYTGGSLFNWVEARTGLVHYIDYRFTRPQQYAYWLSKEAYPQATDYFTLQNEHNKIWRQLYLNYPGIWRESEYVNTDAANAYELYVAARSQLNAVKSPEFTYNVTAMDLYMHDGSFSPLKVQLGDQVRLDYQTDQDTNNVVNQALSEPLYVTGINHTLRTDGDYVFTVSTRRATDTMLRRFAKLLAFK